MPQMIACSVVTPIGIGLLSTLTPESTSAAWIGYQVLTGIGIGLGAQLPYIVLRIKLRPNLLTTGTPSIFFMQAMGNALFITGSQSIFLNRLMSSLRSHVPGVDIPSIIGAGPINIFESVPQQDLAGVRLAYNYALTTTFVAAAGIAAASILGSLAVK